MARQLTGLQVGLSFFCETEHYKQEYMFRTFHCLNNQSNRTHLSNKKHLSVACVPIFFLAPNMGGLIQKVLRCISFNRSTHKYQEIKAKNRNPFSSIFWSQSHMSSVDSKNKWTGLAVPVITERTVINVIHDTCQWFQCYGWSVDIHSSINPVSVPESCLYIQLGAASLSSGSCSQHWWS